jgi:hypothetical protein
MKSYKLTKKQEQAFASLERALLRCEKEGLYIWSNYGTVSAVNGKVVQTVAPDESLGEPLDDAQVSFILSMDIRENSDDPLFVRRNNTPPNHA